MEHLPREIIFEILLQLPYIYYPKLAYVCQKLSKTLTSEPFWKFWVSQNKEQTLISDGYFYAARKSLTDWHWNSDRTYTGLIIEENIVSYPYIDVCDRQKLAQTLEPIGQSRRGFHVQILRNNGIFIGITRKNCPLEIDMGHQTNRNIFNIALCVKQVNPDAGAGNKYMVDLLNLGNPIKYRIMEIKDSIGFEIDFSTKQARLYADNQILAQTDVSSIFFNIQNYYSTVALSSKSSVKILNKY